MDHTLDVQPMAPPLIPLTMKRQAGVPSYHRPVMVPDVVHYLDPTPGACIVDATVGGGGHSLAVLPKLLPEGRLIAIDHDPHALEAARARLVEFESQVTFIHGNYRDLLQLLTDLRIAHVDGLLLDLGMSSLQLDDPARGFSFAHEGPLDMRMDRGQALDAATIVNAWSEPELVKLLEICGEEPFARRIAHRIVQARRQHSLMTTRQLAQVVAAAVPSRVRHRRLHVATKTFQALRIAVNDELGALQELLSALPEVLESGARAVILTYHSLEDRLVKQAFVQGEHAGRWTVLTKKPVRPSMEEVARNPRARSAKLRAIVR